MSPGIRRPQQHLWRTGKTSFPPLTHHRTSTFSHGIYQQCRYRFPHSPGLLSEAFAIPGRAGSPSAGSTAPAGRPRRPPPSLGGTASPPTPPAAREPPACSREGHGLLPASAPRSPPQRSQKPGTRGLCAAHEPEIAHGLKKDRGEAPSSGGGRRPLPAHPRPRRPPRPSEPAPLPPGVLGGGGGEAGTHRRPEERGQGGQREQEPQHGGRQPGNGGVS